MAKVSAEAKRNYFDKIKTYKSEVEKMISREKVVLSGMDAEQPDFALKKLGLANENLNILSYYLFMNDLSVAILGIKNEAFLNDARKACYKAIIYIEDVVTNHIDVPFSEYEEKLDGLKTFPEDKRWDLIRKLGFSIQSIKESYGDNTKWKWSFVELDARMATVTKNLLNLKRIVMDMDPRNENYEIYTEHVRLVKNLLQSAADGYRQKYELSTHRQDDFKIAISYLSALRRLHIIMAEPSESEELKKKIEIWKTKMETDSKNREKKEKLARRIR
ncbi:MAG: hypothetical protein JW874_11275 [Spirochaetales bacterium]|nr:hypothetical protein [Spirochaetales bacterium]